MERSRDGENPSDRHPRPLPKRLPGDSGCGKDLVYFDGTGPDREDRGKLDRHERGIGHGVHRFLQGIFDSLTFKRRLLNGVKGQIPAVTCRTTEKDKAVLDARHAAARRTGAPMTLNDERWTIGGRLRKARMARGLSAGDIARACEVSRQAVSQWESDETQPAMENLDRAATRLTVSMEWLRTGRDPQPDLRIATKKPKRGPAPPHPDMIPEQAMGIGAGALALDDGRVHDWWKLPIGFVTETLRTAPSNLVALRVLSDSMQPAIKLHDVAFIDRSDTAPADGKIYAIDNGVGVILRRMFIGANGEITLRADRDEGLDLVIKRDKLRIVGRCVLAVVLT
jgi:transcriptional regulator with XRE-family HTH domain